MIVTKTIVTVVVTRQARPCVAVYLLLPFILFTHCFKMAIVVGDRGIVTAKILFTGIAEKGDNHDKEKVNSRTNRNCNQFYTSYPSRAVG